MAMQFLFLALLAGIVIPLQFGVNSSLAQNLAGSTAWAAWATFVVGFVVITIYALMTKNPLTLLPLISKVPWWAWTGGAMGAIFVVSTTIAAPHIGSAALVCLVILGQMIMSLIMDHYGIAGFTVTPISTLRIVGCMLLIFGSVLIIKF